MISVSRYGNVYGFVKRKEATSEGGAGFTDE